MRLNLPVFDQLAACKSLLIVGIGWFSGRVAGKANWA